MKRRLLLLSTVLALVSSSAVLVVNAAANESAGACDRTKDVYCVSLGLNTLSDRLDSATLPKLATPAWLADAPSQPQVRSVSYQIASRGTISASMDEFATQVAETLNSPLGWSRLGIQFNRVESGGDFIVWLTESSQVPTFSPDGCDTIVSCTVGNNVIINETRWLNGSDAWNGAGGTLRNYRHMVLNHETGHWLGHGHQYCSGSGQPAAVMQQQTINMQGCAPNPWPLVSEMYSPKLGIRS